MSPKYEHLKSLFDFAVSFIASIFLLIPMCIIAVMIIMHDFGNPLFFQKRVGKSGKNFYIVKFRSMTRNADNLEKTLSKEEIELYKKEYKLKDDPRLIGWKNRSKNGNCFGLLLRQYSIDELPQILFNVLIFRNMSIVGPRPILPEELEENYTAEEQAELLSVKPGITGYWQAFGRNMIQYENHKRQDMELYYVRSRSPKLDLNILLHTVSSVLCKTGAL